MGRKLGGWLGPHLTQSRLGRGLAPCRVASWSMQPFGRNRYGPKIGGYAPLVEGELGPHLTQCGQGWDLPVCQVSSWSVQPRKAAQQKQPSPTFRSNLLWHGRPSHQLLSCFKLFLDNILRTSYWCSHLRWKFRPTNTSLAPANRWSGSDHPATNPSMEEHGTTLAELCPSSCDW